MKIFSTLLWLEYRKSRVFLVSLGIASMLFVLAFGNAKGEFEVSGMSSQMADYISRFLPMVITMVLGGLGLFLSILSRGQGVAQEGNGGQLQLLILTPASGFLHFLARFVALYAPVAFAVFVTLSLVWLRSNASSIGFNAFSFYGSYMALFFSVTLLPLCVSFSLLSGICVSAYSFRGNSSAIKILFALGALIFTTSILINFKSLLDAPVLNIGFSFLLEAPPGLGVPLSVSLPLGLFAACFLMSVFFLWLAGRIWDEVEV